MAIIKPTSIEQQDILEDLLVWLANQPEDQGWSEAFIGSNGRLVLDLVAGNGSFLSHQARASRREANALTAKLLSSVLAIAFTFGYPVNRRRAARLSLNVTNARVAGDTMGDTINLARTPILGMAGTPPRPISILDTTVTDSSGRVLPLSIGPGETVNIRCAVGEWASSDEIAASSTDFAELVVEPPTGRDILDVDNDAVFLNNITDNDKVSLTRYLELVNDDPVSVLIKTHPTALVFLFGTSSAGSSRSSSWTEFTHRPRHGPPCGGMKDPNTSESLPSWVGSTRYSAWYVFP